MNQRARAAFVFVVLFVVVVTGVAVWAGVWELLVWVASGFLGVLVVSSLVSAWIAAGPP